MNINISSGQSRKDAVFHVDWETDGDRGALAALPKEVNVPIEIAEQGIQATLDYLSDEYGWLVLHITRLIR